MAQAPSVLLALLPPLLLCGCVVGAGDADPSWGSVSALYPLLAHSREALGIADHPTAAALEQVMTSASHLITSSHHLYISRRA